MYSAGRDPKPFFSSPEPLRPLAWSQDPAPLLPFTPPATAATVTSGSPSSSLSSPAVNPPENTVERPVPKPRRVSMGKTAGDQIHAPIGPSPETSLQKNLPNELAHEGDVHVKVPSSTTDEETVITPTIQSFSIYDSPRSSTSNSSSDPDTHTSPAPAGGGGVLTPPLPPNPWRNARQHSSTPESQTISPLVTSHNTVTPPTAASARTPTSLASPLPTTTRTVQNAISGLPTAVPLAIAFQETCNAIFKSTDPSDCILKVTGEVVVSFPASLVGHVENYGTLTFRLKETDELTQVLHNQILLTRYMTYVACMNANVYYSGTL